MRVTEVKTYGDPVHQVNLTFAAVSKPDGYPADGKDEDNSYARWTPMAELKMTIQNPSLLDKFVVGQKYYVDFVACE